MHVIEVLEIYVRWDIYDMAGMFICFSAMNGCEFIQLSIIYGLGVWMIINYQGVDYVHG